MQQQQPVQPMQPMQQQPVQPMQPMQQQQQQQQQRVQFQQQVQYNDMTRAALTFLYSLGVDIENDIEIVANEYNVEGIRMYEEDKGKKYFVCIICDAEINQYVINWKYEFVPENVVNTLAFINEVNVGSVGPITYLDANEANPGIIFKKVGTFSGEDGMFDDIVECMEHAHLTCDKL